MNIATPTLHRLIFGCLLIAAPAVMAADTKEQTAWSVEAKVLAVESSGTVAEFTLDDEESGASIGVGYAFNRNFAVQGAYHRLGNHFATDCPPPLVCIIQNEDQVDITGVSLAVIGTWPITPMFEVYGKVGAMRWDVDFDRFARDDVDRDVVFGGGVGLSLGPNWRLTLQYEKVLDFDLESAGLGVSYRF